MEILFDKWSFVEKDMNQTDWFIKITGGKFDEVVYKYKAIKLDPDNESINFDYDVEDYPGDNPHGTEKFNKAIGVILRSVLDDAFKHKDFVLGDKPVEDD